MKVLLYKVIFEATHTLQNGKEYTGNAFVYMKPFDAATGKHNSPEMQIAKGTAALEAEHYYNIKYKRTETTYKLFAE